jgi:hypothetical protein
MEVKAWFFGWAYGHINRCPKPGWPKLFLDRVPEDAVDFFAPWIQKFDTFKVSRDVAEDASILLVEGEYPYPGPAHLDALLQCIRKVWHRRRAEKQQSGRASQDPNVRVSLATTLADARLRSNSCPECQGNGFASRERQIEKQRYRFSFFCRCPSGRWLKSHYDDAPGDDHIGKRARDLQTYPELWEPGLDSPLWDPEPVIRDWALEPGWIVPEPVGLPDLQSRPIAKLLTVVEDRNLGRVTSS